MAKKKILTPQHQVVKKEYLALNSPSIRRLTYEVNQLMSTLLRDSSETIVEVGEKLTGIKAKLEHGEWLKWLASSSYFSVDSAERYIHLARFSHTHPGTFSKLKELGPSKLYVISRLPNQLLRIITRKKYFCVPGTEKTKTLARMSVIEFYLVINKLFGRPKFDLQIELRSLTGRVKSVIDKVQVLLPHAEKLSEEEIILMERQLKNLLNQLRQLR